MVLLALLGFVVSCGNAGEREGLKNLDALKAADLIKQESVLILDVRTPAEYREAHIKDSILIPLQELETGYTKISEHANRPVLIYCRSGNRSVAAANILISKGFTDLYHLKGGINDWIKKQLPVVTSP